MATALEEAGFRPPMVNAYGQDIISPHASNDPFAHCHSALEGLWPIETPVTEEAFSAFRPQEWAVHVLKFEGCSGVLVGPNHLFITNQHCIKRQLKRTLSKPTPKVLWPLI